MRSVRSGRQVAALVGALACLGGCNFDEATQAAQQEILDHTHDGENVDVAALQAEVAALRAEVDALAAGTDLEERVAALEAALGTPFPGPRTVKQRLENLEDAGFLTAETDPIASAAGYLTTETDPVATAAGYLTEETDPVASAAGYLTTETDPIATAAGYLTTETDPVAATAGYLLETAIDIDNAPEAAAPVTLQITDAAPDQTVTTPWNVAGCRFLYLAIEVDYQYTGGGVGATAARIHLDQAVGQAGDVAIEVADPGTPSAVTHVWVSRDTPTAATADIGLDAASAIGGTITADVTLLGCIE